MSDIADLAQFQSVIAEGVTLVDFYGTWCGPCKALAPFIDQLAEEFTGKAHVLKLDIEQAPEIPTHLGVRGVPTVMVFKNGVAQATIIGSGKNAHIRAALEQALAS
jgi:thioredoxin 1